MAEEQKPIDELVEKIAKECEEANTSKWLVVRIIKELNEFEPKESEKMRAKALEILRQADPKAATVFASFQKMTVRTSKQRIEPFDRGNIIKSLLKETEIPRGVAEKIGREVEDKINEMQISYITTALIRELANVKLLEYGHEAIRNQYARIGLPISDVEKKIEKNPFSNTAIMTEYNLLKAIPKELSDLHFSSDIFIGNIGDFCTKPLSIAIQAQKKKSLKKTIFETIKKANYLQKFFSWGINISEANLAIAALIEKKQAEEAADLFASALSLMQRKKPFGEIGLNLFVPEHVEFEIDNETLIVCANKLIEKIREQEIKAGISLLVDTKYKINMVNKKQCKKVSFVNCKKNYLLPFNGIAADKGLLCFFALNLPKQALGSAKEEFLEKTIGLAKKIRLLGELKKSELEKREYLKRAGIGIEKMRPCLGLYGIMQAGKMALGTAKQKECFEFCEKTVKEIKKALGEEWLLVETESPLAIRRFEEKNRLLQLESKGDEQKNLLKSGLYKQLFFRGNAKSRAMFNRLMDENIAWIDFKK